jgi:hypothetical protein
MPDKTSFAGAKLQRDRGATVVHHAAVVEGAASRNRSRVQSEIG